MVIALAGRPNVGKSSLFNRFVRRRRSIVWDRPGVTRDLIRGDWKIDDDRKAEVWDLAGVGKPGISIADLPIEARKKIDLVLLVIDGSEPLTAEDLDCIRELRKLSKPVVVAVNKSDKSSFQDYSEEIRRYFSRSCIPISAEQKKGFDALEDAVLKHFSAAPADMKRQALVHRRVLILGRPNVGKSSLLNALVKDRVSYVSHEAGTTRDIVGSDVTRKGVRWEFFDSAGVRKKSKIFGRKADPVEIFSVDKSLKELNHSDFALFVIEATTDGRLRSQDRKLLHLVRSSLLPAVILVNKWDLVRKEWTEDKYRKSIKYQLGDLDFLPIIFVSAKTGFRVEKIFQVLQDLSRGVREISTSQLNRWMKKVFESRSPRVARRGTKSDYQRTATQYLHFLYIVQTSTQPMAFQIFCNAPQAVAEEDRRYLLNQLRQEFQLFGIPIKFIFRRKTS